MAIFIFSKNSDNKLGCLYRIASSQSVYDANKNWQDDLYDIITVNDDDYTAVKLGTKSVISKNGSTVSYQETNTSFNTPVSLTSYINSITDIINEWLINNSSKPLASLVITYKNFIQSIDVSSLSITEENPLNSSLEAYVENQGVTSIHPLELF
jgi:hypothetical protein